MDYILILVAVICYAAQFAFTKVYERCVKQTMTTTLTMLVVIGTTGAFISLCVNGFRVQFSAISLVWAAVFALTTIPYYMIGIKVLSMGNLAIYSMFMMLGGMLVPFAYGVVFLQEVPSMGKILGTLLLTSFIALQALAQKMPENRDAGKAKCRQKLLFFVLCMGIFYLNGLTGVIVKAHQLSLGAVNEASFTATACSFTAILSFVLLMVSLLKDRGRTVRQAKQTLQYKPICFVVLVGAVQQIGNVFLLMAASNVPASVQFPLVSGGVIILSALVSAFVFKEKLSRMEWIAIAGAFASTVLYAL